MQDSLLFVFEYLIHGFDVQCRRTRFKNLIYDRTGGLFSSALARERFRARNCRNERLVNFYLPIILDVIPNLQLPDKHHN